MSNSIRHSGIVESVGDGIIRVKILQTSACSQCKAANHCSASESKEKIIDVFSYQPSYKVGDQVTVIASARTGMNAVLLGFGVPFLILVAVVWLMMFFSGNEPLSALLGIASLIPYYLLLYFLRDRLRQKLSFAIE